MVKQSYTQRKQSTGVDFHIHSCLTSALDDGEWSAPWPLSPRKYIYRYPLNWIQDGPLEKN